MDTRKLPSSRVPLVSPTRAWIRGSVLRFATAMPVACDGEATTEREPDTPTTTLDTATSEPELAAAAQRARKQMDLEAQMNLRKIAFAAASVAQRSTVGADGALVPFELMAAPVTPAGRCCMQPKGMCVANAADWRHPAWRALGFAVTDPHALAYELTVNAAGFTARGIGDVRCDGELTIFELRGTLDAEGVVEFSKLVATPSR